MLATGIDSEAGGGTTVEVEGAVAGEGVEARVGEDGDGDGVRLSLAR